MAFTQLINSNVNNQFGLTSKYSLQHLIFPHWSLMTFTNLGPQKMLSRGKWRITPPANHRSHNASHHGCWRVEVVCWAHNRLTHCFSEHGRKQMLDCQTKYTQTPYQFMDVMDPAGRRSPLAYGGPLGVPRHIRSCMEPVCACAEGQALWEYWGVHTVQPFRQLTEERWRENEQVFMGQQQENVCYVTITPYDGKDCTVSG